VHRLGSRETLEEVEALAVDLRTSAPVLERARLVDRAYVSQRMRRTIRMIATTVPSPMYTCSLLSPSAFVPQADSA
jgi:hypothetical protein